MNTHPRFQVFDLSGAGILRLGHQLAISRRPQLSIPSQRVSSSFSYRQTSRFVTQTQTEARHLTSPMSLSGASTTVSSSRPAFTVRSLAGARFRSTAYLLRSRLAAWFGRHSMAFHLLPFSLFPSTSAMSTDQATPTTNYLLRGFSVRRTPRACHGGCDHLRPGSLRASHAVCLR